MWLRRAFFRWLIPAAFVLPLWLLIGWGVFQAGGWAFLWVLFIAIPSVFLGQLVLSLLVRSRPSVRALRAVSWADVAGFTLWHGLTIAVGFFSQQTFGWLLAGAIAVFLGLFWLSLWQLWGEARGGGIRIRETAVWSTAAPVDDGARQRRATTGGHPVIVVRESETGDRGD